LPEDELSERKEDNDRLAQHLKQLVESTGEVEKAIEALVSDHSVSKRVAESLACDLDFLPKRYKLNAGTLGNEGQKRLLRSKVVVVGLGGLGGYVVDQLARCGAGTIIAVDEDRFEETNLNRQLLADVTTIGRSKTETARDRIAAVNDAVEFQAYECQIESLPDSAYNQVDVIFDCLDNIPTKLHLQDVSEGRNIPLIHGAIGGWYGQLAVVWPGSQLLSAIYGTRQEGIERALGNPPFTPALIATLMVTEGIKVLLGQKQEENSVLFVDLLNNNWEHVNF
jgi:molybdopterin/thiamine biosynthesis adenylyltransferase